jgi:hypothetical protein
MWRMAKKKAKSVKPKASKRPAKKGKVTSRAQHLKKTASRARPAAKKSAKPIAKKVVKSKAKKATKPVAAKATKPVAKKVVKAKAKKATKPVAAKATKPVAAKAAKPVATKASKPVAAVTPAPALAKTSPRHDSGLRRRDGAGHLDPKYAADLLSQSGRPEVEGVAFLENSRSTDDLAESFGEQFVEGATTGEGPAEEELDQEVPEERGGPFVRSNAGTEFAEGTDRSNPKGAKREPFPTT